MSIVTSGTTPVEQNCLIIAVGGSHCPSIEDRSGMEQTASGMQHLALNSCQGCLNHQHGKRLSSVTIL